MSFPHFPIFDKLRKVVHEKILFSKKIIKFKNIKVFFLFSLENIFQNLKKKNKNKVKCLAFLISSFF
jgi:hypothetical protein